MVFLIPAGGQGEKLWPYSRRNNPKTFQKIIGDISLMRRTIDTLLKISKPRDIYISTKGLYRNVALKDIPEIPKENYLLEPDFFKNRGPGEGYAFMMLSLLRPDEPFMIVQPDCIREPEEEFLKMIEGMEKLVTKEKKLITGGIEVTEPIMGVDFLKLGERVDIGYNLEIYSTKEYMDRKDNFEETKELVENNKLVIHSNHNCWYPELMLNAYKKHRPDWYKSLMKIKEFVGKPDEKEKTNEIYSKMEKGSTEEVTKHEFKNGFVISLPFKWHDMGTWESVYKYLNKDGNYKPEKDVISVESNDVYVKSSGKRLIATLGVEDLVIVETDDVTLVADKSKSGEVKKVLEELENKDKSKFL